MIFVLRLCGCRSRRRFLKLPTVGRAVKEPTELVIVYNQEEGHRVSPNAGTFTK